MPAKKKNRDRRVLQKLFGEVRTLIENAPDAEFPGILGDEFARLLQSVAPPKVDQAQTIYDYLLQNKHRLTVIARMHQVMTTNHTLPGLVNGMPCRVSPFPIQWFDDGVMFVQGAEPFGGIIGLYQHGMVKFAIAARDIPRGVGFMGQDDFIFVDADEANARINQKSIPKTLPELTDRIAQLECLLAGREEDEAEYQKFLQENPWCFGAQYKQIDSHRVLDDATIPDFTGVRVKDGARDIIEIKQPFLALFRQDDDFRSEFNNAYNQVERYLDFTRMEADYLHREKGLFFDNPHCYLLVGFDLSREQIKALRRKEKMNPAITILTYNDLLAMAKNTVEWVRALKEAPPSSITTGATSDISAA